MPEEQTSVNFNNQESTPHPYPGSLWKIWQHKRYIVAILGFLGYMNIYALRTNLSIAIVDMTQLKPLTLENGTIISTKEFDWSSAVQGYVLSSFFYGYVTTQIVGGYFAAKFGGAKVFGFGIATTSILTLLTPWVAKMDVYFLIVVRTIEGAFEGVTYPAMQDVWAHWAPPMEKSRLVSIAASGAYFGAVIAMPICSLLASAFGWETIFYVFGALGLLWYTIWLIVVADTPTKDKWINSKEADYIRESLKTLQTEDNIKIPWCTIFKSTAVLANTICLTCETWGFYTMLTFLPQIMKSLLGFNLNKAGFLSALPYLVTSVMVQLGGYLSDILIRKECLNTTKVRKLSIIFGFISQSIFIIVASFWISPVGTPLCLVIAVGLGGLSLSALIINPLDVAPKFASIIFGINNTSASLSGIISPILTGYIVTEQTSVEQWRIVFFISSAMYLFGAVTSFMFTTGERQSWGNKKENNQEMVPQERPKVYENKF